MITVKNLKVPTHDEPPKGYARIYAGTTPDLARYYAEMLLTSGRTVCFVRVPGFKLAVYAKT